MSQIDRADRAAGPQGKAQWVSALVEKVIRVRFLRGIGTPDDPLRTVDAWFTHDGELIAERDPEVRP